MHEEGTITKILLAWLTNATRRKYYLYVSHITSSQRPLIELTTYLLTMFFAASIEIFMSIKMN